MRALLAWCLSQEVVFFWSSVPERDRECALKAAADASCLVDDDPTALTAVGATYSQCCDQKKAAVFIERALALDTNNAWAWTRYGWVAVYTNDAQGAKDRFKRALTLSPFDPFTFNLRIGIAAASAIAGDYGEAARITREVLDKNPRVTWAYRVLAGWSALAGDLDTARKAVRELLAHQPHASVELYRRYAPVNQLNPYLDKSDQSWARVSASTSCTEMRRRSPPRRTVPSTT